MALIGETTSNAGFSDRPFHSLQLLHTNVYELRRHDAEMAQVAVGNPRRLEPKMESHPVQTVCCLSVVVDGIAICVKTSASLNKALAFRAFELSLTLSPRERIHECFVEQIVLPLKEEIVGELQLIPQDSGPDQNANQMGGYPGASGHAGSRADRAGVGEVDPTGTRATADRRACTRVSTS